MTESHCDSAASQGWTISSVGIQQDHTIRSKFSCSTGLPQSAAMKFILIAAVALLALAQGSFAQDTADLENLGQYFMEMKNKMAQELTELIHSHDLKSHAQTFLDNKKTQLEPLATQIQDQLKSVATNAEDQIRPLTENVQAQIQPMVDNFHRQIEAILQKLTEQAKAIGN
ncbi:hypothetical protein Q5P01_018366 [Channa striata]|uniref:Type-4 ice-structuring protein LS-12-like n=1 Tax=Channa striata TaxID=64152 RepID=A0AA88S833_CHASR|nr:hypothetical protein Q5P01_018366 [Channa striata]